MRGCDVTTESDAEDRYNALLFSSTKTLEAKEKEHSNIITGIVIIAAMLFAAWIVHENAWQRKLDLALSDCLTPLTDGSCPARNPAYR
jgi:hypothetical protein